MLFAVPIRLITGNPEVDKLFNQLPLDVQDYLINYSDNFQKQAIVPLLESNETDFPKKFNESVIHLLNYVIQTGTYFAEKEKSYPNIMNDLITFYMASFQALKNTFSDLPDKVAIGISNTLEILLDYMMLVADPKIMNEVSKPEYVPALEAFMYLALSIGSLMYIYKYENKIYEQKTDILLQYCNNYSKTLEEYTETMEIETNPEDMKRLEKIKM